MVNLESLEDLFVYTLNKLRDAESVIIDALPKMVDAAHSEELKEGFQQHLRQSQQQLARLDDVMDNLGYSPIDVTCKAMRALVDECEEIIDSPGDPDVKDAALIAAAQSVEHYEIAGYGTVRTFARQLGYDEAADLLQETLNQEGDTDKKLTRLAEGQACRRQLVHQRHQRRSRAKITRRESNARQKGTPATGWTALSGKSDTSGATTRRPGVNSNGFRRGLTPRRSRFS